MYRCKDILFAIVGLFILSGCIGTTSEDIQLSDSSSKQEIKLVGKKPWEGLEHHILKLDLTYDETIVDVYKWSLEQFADGPLDDSEWAERVKKHGLMEAEADLDFDGRAELLIRQNVPGRVWCYLVFKQIEGGYRYIGNFSGGYFKILPPNEERRPQILASDPIGGHYCRILKFTHDGERFVMSVVDEFSCGDGAPEENNRRLDELFDGFKKRVEFRKVW